MECLFVYFDPVFIQRFLYATPACLSELYYGNVNCKSNLRLYEKVLIIFGYFLFYEYNIISRNYGLSVLLLFLLVQQYLQNKESILKLAIILFFLSNTHLFSLLISIAFVFAYVVNERVSLRQKNIKMIAKAALIVLSSWFISVISIIPPIQYASIFLGYETSGYFSSDRIIKTISACLKGIFYIPDFAAPEGHFQNSLYLFALNPGISALCILSLIGILIPVFIVKKNSFALTFFVSFLVIFLSVYYFLPLNYGIRYFGFFFIVFVACFWIARTQISKAGLIFSTVLFFLQFMNGAYAFTMDLKKPFSQSKNISKFLQRTRYPGEKILIMNMALRPAISSYCEEKFFAVENGKYISYCCWNDCLSDSVLKLKISDELQTDSTALVVSTEKLDLLFNTENLKPIQSFHKSILAGEDAIIYRYRVRR